MMWFYHEKLRNFNIFINNNSLVLVFLFDMANTNLFNLLPRHIAADYLKLESITSKLQRIVSNIAFIKKALHHNLVPTFEKVQG